MTDPICPYFGRCGGCSDQDRELSEQLESKRSRLCEALEREDIRVYSGRPYQYRNRMDFVFHARGLGLREKGAFDKFVDIEQCAISNSKLNTLLTEVREFFKGVFYFDVRRRFGAYCYAVIRTPSGSSSVSIVLNKKDKRLAEAKTHIKAYAEITQADNVLVTYVPHNRNVSISEEYEVIKGSDLLQDNYHGHNFLFPTQGFFQVNHEMASQVHTYCRELLTEYPGTSQAHFLDLYGGVGTFGILNASRFQKVTVLENFPPAIQAAQQNLIENGVKNAETICRDAKQLNQLEFPQPLYVIIDPPRSGIHPKALTQLNQLNCESLLYVSCNPKLLGRDLKELTNFQIGRAALFDMFPQTPHMEAVVELLPKK